MYMACVCVCVCVCVSECGYYASESQRDVRLGLT